jgi:hypothetical protein
MTNLFATRHLVLFFLALLVAIPGHAADLIPTPEFTDHTIPISKPPEPDNPIWEWVNVGVLIAALSLASYFALVNRSRRGLFLLAIGSLIWFGFMRAGCVCSIGATQNIAQALYDSSYAIPTTVVIIFALPSLPCPWSLPFSLGGLFVRQSVRWAPFRKWLR